MSPSASHLLRARTSTPRRGNAGSHIKPTASGIIYGGHEVVVAAPGDPPPSSALGEARAGGSAPGFRHQGSNPRQDTKYPTGETESQPTSALEVDEEDNIAFASVTKTKAKNKARHAPPNGSSIDVDDLERFGFLDFCNRVAAPPQLGQFQSDLSQLLDSARANVKADMKGPLHPRAIFHVSSPYLFVCVTPGITNCLCVDARVNPATVLAAKHC